MNCEVSVRYTPEIIRRAAREYWTRQFKLRDLIVLGSLIVASIYLWARGDRSWLLGFLVACAFLFSGVAIASYFIYLRRSMEKFKRMAEPVGKFRFTEERIGIESDIGFTELSWKMIDQLWTSPEVWLILIAKQGYVTLPIEDLDEDLKRFMVRKVAENGGIVSQL